MRSKQEKILIIKHGALGDIMQGMDGFASVRAWHKTAHMAVLTTSPYVSLLSASPYFDAVVTDRRAPLWDVVGYLQLRRLLKQGGWTRVYDFQCSRRTAWYFRHFLRQSRCEFVGKAPMTSLSPKSHGISHPIPDMTGLTTCQRMLETAKLGGCKAVVPDFAWLYDKSTLPLPAKPYAVLVAGSSAVKPSKRWPPHHYAKLAEAIWHGHAIRPVLVGTDIDRKVLAEIAHQAPCCLSLVGSTDLFDLARLFRHAQCAVGNDTGPMFIAGRMPPPSLTVMGGDTDPILSAAAGGSAHWLKVDDLRRLSVKRVLGRLAAIGGLKT